MINYTPTSITTNCQFAIGSPALGCLVHIFKQTALDTPIETITVMRDANEQGLPLNAERTVNDLESGLYTVIVYDIESDGLTNTDGEPAYIQIVDITEPTKPPSISSETPSGTSGQYTATIVKVIL